MNKNAVIMIGIMVGTCVAVTDPACAQIRPPVAQPQQPEVAEKRSQIMEKINKEQEQAHKLQERINAIARQAMEQNPEIQKLHTELMEIYQKKLPEYGYPSEAEMKQLQDMQQLLQSPAAEDMDQAERQQLTQKFNTGVAKLQEAQEKAQNDPKVRAAHEAFTQARSKTMSQIDSEAPALEREFKNIQGKLEQLRMKLQQVLQPSQ